MATQDGILMLRGKIGQVIFYKSGGKHLARHSGSLTKKRMATDPAFARSRQSAAAFKHAAQGAGLLRTAMGLRAKKLGETYLTGRLSGLMMAILKTDEGLPMSERRIYNGDMDLLRGVSWQRKKPLTIVLKEFYTVHMDRGAGKLSISFASFEPRTGLKAPKGASHFELFAAAAALDFDKITFTAGDAESGAIALTAGATGPIVLNCAVPAGSSLPLVLGLGVVFFQEVSGKKELLVGGGCFELVAVEV